MGDILLKTAVKTSTSGKAVQLNLYFDSGSPRTFVREDAAKKCGKYMRMESSEPFHGLGEGKFYAIGMADLEVNLRGIWCRHPSYVVPDFVLDSDILIGHDFMQVFDIRLDMRKRKIITDRKALLRAQIVRTAANSKW